MTRNGLERALTAGRDVEQWLEVRQAGNRHILRWLSIEHRRDGRVAVREMEVWDDGGPDFLDVYEFTSCDPDNPDGVEHVFERPDEALQFAIWTLGADPDRFVNQGVVQFEYRDSLVDRSGRSRR